MKAHPYHKIVKAFSVRCYQNIFTFATNIKKDLPVLDIKIYVMDSREGVNARVSSNTVNYESSRGKYANS